MSMKAAAQQTFFVVAIPVVVIPRPNPILVVKSVLHIQACMWSVVCRQTVKCKYQGCSDYANKVG